MRTKTGTRNDEEMGIGTKLTLGLLLWKLAKGGVKLGAMAGAAVLGWKLATRAFDRTASQTETPAIA